MKDAIVTFGLAGTLALVVTAHLATFYGLLWRPPRWRAPAALVFPPAGVVWGWREKMYVRAVALVVGMVGYGVAYVLGRQG